MNVKSKQEKIKNYNKAQRFINYTREDLLGIGKAFSLDNSEIIAERIFEYVLNLVMNKIRLKYVDSLMNSYVAVKSIKMINFLVDIQSNTNSPDPEIEFTSINLKHKYFGNFEVTRPKIDSWASNKSKILVVKPEELSVLTPYTPDSSHKTNTSNISKFVKSFATQNSFNQIIKSKLNPVSSKKTNKRYTTTVDAVTTSFTNQEINSFTNFVNQSSNHKLKEESYSNISEISKNDKQFTQNINQDANLIQKKNLIEQYPLVTEELKIEPVDELEEIKLKTLRTYFKEKELDRDRKKKYEKENEERKRDEDKRLKRVLEGMEGSYTFDLEGKILSVKPPNIDHLNHILSPDTTIKHVKNEEKRLKMKENVFTTPNLTPKKSENSVADLTQTNYQPDPLNSHVLPPGVSMISYGIRKDGGNFPEIPGRLSNKEFKTVLKTFRPVKINKLIVKNILNEQTQNEKSFVRDMNIISEDEENNLKDSMKLSKIFTSEEVRENKNIPIVNSYKNINPTNRKPRKNNKHENLNKKIEKIIANKELNLKNLNKLDDEKLYEIFHLYHETLEKETLAVNKQKNKLPNNVHISIEKELGLMKKYPRERVAKNILVISGKLQSKEEKIIKNIKLNENKEKKLSFYKV